MYSSDLNPKDRSSAIGAALLIQAALLIAFLNMGGRLQSNDSQVPLHLVDITMPAPPPPVVERHSPKVREKDPGSSEVNIKSAATAVAAPKTVLPVINRVAATTTPRNATDPTQGASLVHGPGTGAGGTGTGDGSGSGNGPGDGGGTVEPPHLATPVLSSYDFPRDFMDLWPRGATIFLRLKINARGYVSECLVDRGTNVPEIDSEMCNLAHERLRFWPALNRNRQAVAGWFGYAQPAPR
jgi:protein TonB